MRAPDNTVIEGALDVVVHASSICVLHDDRRVSCDWQWMRAPEDKFEKIVPFGTYICGLLSTGGWFCFSELTGRRDLCTPNDQDRCMTQSNVEVSDLYPNNYNNGLNWGIARSPWLNKSCGEPGVPLFRRISTYCQSAGKESSDR